MAPSRAEFSEREVLRDNFVQQGAGNLREMTAGTTDDVFRPALYSVHLKTSQTAFHSRRELELEPPPSTAATMIL